MGKMVIHNGSLEHTDWPLVAYDFFKTHAFTHTGGGETSNPSRQAFSRSVSASTDPGLLGLFFLLYHIQCDGFPIPSGMRR